MKTVHEGGNQSGGGGRGHTNEIFGTARRHALHVEPCKPPRATDQECKAADPGKLSYLLKRHTAVSRQTAEPPSVGQDRWRDSKTYDVREGIKLYAEVGVCFQEPSEAAVQRIEQNRKANS